MIRMMRTKINGKKPYELFSSRLGGAIIGALLILLAFPGSGLLNNDEKESTTEKPTERRTTEQSQQNLTLDVTSAVTNAVDKASDAVVGITNIQETNFWGQGATPRTVRQKPALDLESSTRKMAARPISSRIITSLKELMNLKLH